MNFVQAANEIANWASVHPLMAAAVVAGTALATWVGVRAAITRHKANKANRAEVEAILARLPKPGRVEITNDKELRYYDGTTGRLKHRVPSGPQ